MQVRGNTAEPASGTVGSFTPVDDEDRVGHRHAGGHVDEHGVRQERVVEEDERVATDLGATDHFRATGDVVAAAEPRGRSHAP